MASSPFPSAPISTTAAPAAAPAPLAPAALGDSQPDCAVFELERPLIVTIDGQDHEITGLGMRAFGTDDLPLLDRFLGQPIALTRHLIAALCDITVDQVNQLAIDDFAMLASDALYQVERVSRDMGLPSCFFLQPIGEAAGQTANPAQA